MNMNMNKLQKLIIVIILLLSLTGTYQVNSQFLQYLKISNYLTAGCFGNPVSYSWLQLNRCRSNTIYVVTNSSNPALTSSSSSGFLTGFTSGLSGFTNPITSLMTSSSSAASSSSSTALPIVPVVVEMYCIDPTCSQPENCIPGQAVPIDNLCTPSTNGFFMIYSIENSIVFTKDNNMGNCYSQSYQSVCNLPPYHAT
ncbi:hypothetical protein PPL_02950 [Heterostelium album PN500]|uniref:Uncharacterized protein n=1 Tax=Heterostelium pallidum (strain ATCC 26659 / Pp 5 / PN500) TaxID=670386 RepID=D3B3I2_HETP5|nr:hypothetical protein PPL_02950 [Heterostelium album PN500]EFA83880.1 hypothetical protein PPL_02950 [Heterostelium album PN500]|eukprot:XP_020435997.1 hypothetical protein PPL_02950 [Heterostelium album PN500]